MNSLFTKISTCGLEYISIRESQNADLLRIVKAQTALLIASLNDNNFLECSLEIENLITTFGEDVIEHLFFFLLSDIYTSLETSSVRSALLNQHANFQKKKTQSTLAFCKAFHKFCNLNTTKHLNLSCFIASIGPLDSFDKAILSLSLLFNVQDTIRQQALLMLHENMSTLSYILPTIQPFEKDIVLHFVDYFIRATDLNLYEPSTDSAALVLVLAEKYLSDTLLMDKLQGIIQVSSQKTKLNELDTLLNTYNKYSMTQSEMLRVSNILEELASCESSFFKNSLDVLIEKQAFPSILDVLPPQISVNIALRASSEKHFDMKDWIETRAQDNVFGEHCFYFLLNMVVSEPNSQPTHSKLQERFPVELLKNALKAASCSGVPIGEVTQLQNQLLGRHSDFDTIIDGLKTPVTEEETNTYYERLYGSIYSVKKMVDMLKQLKTSGNSRDRQLFTCMIHTLFDEYPFFSKYPEKELNITSILFGQLIQNNILTDDSLEKASDCILEALSIPGNPKLVTFGIHALNQFEYRLSELPQFCAKILQIPYFVKSQPRLTSVVTASQKNKNYEPRLREILPITCIYLPSLSKPRTDDSIQFSNPDDETKDKISFVIDGLTKSNISIRTAELKTLLITSYYPWFSRYIVSRVISSSTDFHNDASVLLECIGSKTLNIHILYATLSKIMMVLNYANIPPSEMEHSYSIKIGSWLGRLTLANDKPLLEKYINIKGFYTQRQSIVIPMVCKILEQGLNGKVFLAPNPWTMAIIRNLIGVYHLANIENSLKIEIETLLKDVSINTKGLC